MNDGPLYDRYTIEVTRKDGQPVPDDKRYFVLDLSTPDERDLAGLQAYAAACRRTGYPQLADAIKAQLPQPKRKRDDYVLIVRVYLDYQRGYAHELRPDHPEDIAALQGSIDGELDGATGEIRVLWPDYPGGFVPYQHRSTIIEVAGNVFRRLQQRQAHGRIVIHFGDHDVMWLTEWILKAEWDAAEEFTGW